MAPFEQYLREVRLKRSEVSSFKTYPFSLPAVRTLDALELHPKVTFLIGENGSGKSTLLEAIAVALGSNPEGGSRNFSFGRRESHSELHRYLRLVITIPHRYTFTHPHGLSGRVHLWPLGLIDRIDYYDTEHYRVMHGFLANPKRMLDVLLDPQEENEEQ